MKLQFFMVWRIILGNSGSSAAGSPNKKLCRGELFAEFAGHGGVALGDSTGVV